MSSNESKLGYLKFLTETPPAVLYHYTSMEGLLGIVQSGKIRASDSRYLNDATDSTYLLGLLKNYLAQRKATDPDRKYYEDLLSALGKTTTFEVFVASFSENGDSLSQWRAYSTGGIGFSIGFHAKALRTGHVSDPSGRERHFVYERLSHVRYLSDASESSLEGVLNDTREWARLMSGSAAPLGIPIDPIGFNAGSLSIFAPAFKHVAFEEEREWRLILSKIPGPMPAKQFRVGRSTLIPYVEVEPQMKEAYFIKEVIVGPTPHPELSKDSIKALFESLNHPEVTVRVSSVPYRHW